MSSYRKSLTRTILKEYGRFPNAETSQKIELGQVGTYDGRKAQFSWLYTLEGLGVPVNKPNQEHVDGFVDEQFTIGSKTAVVFTADAQGAPSAEISLGRARSLIAQSTDMVCISYDQEQLRRAIVDTLDRGTAWSYDWVVVTHVFVAAAYSQFFSQSKNAYLTVSAGTNSPIGPFNLADTSLGLSISKRIGSVHHILATTDVTPFFLVQKLKGRQREDRSNPNISAFQNLRLEAYG